MSKATQLLKPEDDGKITSLFSWARWNASFKLGWPSAKMAGSQSATHAHTELKEQKVVALRGAVLGPTNQSIESSRNRSFVQRKNVFGSSESAPG